MPKKHPLCIPSEGAPRQARAFPSRSDSHARKPAVTFQLQDHEGDDINDDQDETGGGGEGEDESSMAEMLTMLQEFQKRKATKTSARSITFQNAKSALFSDARKKVDKAVRDGTTALENAHAAIINVKAKEISQESALASLKSLWDSQDECVQDLVGNLSGVIEDLAHRRAAQINETSAMLEAQVAAREDSRKRLLAQASAYIEENIENQRIATDASDLIKHYKALLRS